MAFKGDNDDTRDSLSFKCRRLLQNEGAEVPASVQFLGRQERCRAFPTLFILVTRIFARLLRLRFGF